MFIFEPKFGDSPLKMPMRYWIGLAILLSAYLLARSYGPVDVMVPALYIGATVFSMIWFRGLSQLSGFGGWCLLPVFFLLVVMEDLAYTAIFKYDENIALFGMAPLMIFALFFFKSYARFRDPK